MKKIEFVVQKISIRGSKNAVPTYNFEDCVPLKVPVTIVNKNIIDIMNDRMKDIKITLVWEDE